MRLLHTADWHLGQTLHGLSREAEHKHFLDWLLETLNAQAVDALVIAGDVFDSQNPPVSALAGFYQFLADAKRVQPDLTVIVIAGNHDSGGRLEAPLPLLEALGVRVIGSLHKQQDGTPDLLRLLVPLSGPDGVVTGWCAAVPYLRQSDLPASNVELTESVRAIYAEIVAMMRERRKPGQVLVAIGHCYMAGGLLSEQSERKILGGNLHALPVDMFPADIDYVALGHLHRAQEVGGREAVRYSGSPLPLSLNERAYCHQVVLVEFQDGVLAGIEALAVPRLIDILRLPAQGAVLPEHLPTLLATLPKAVDDRRGRDNWPLLEVVVRQERPNPGLRAQVEELLDGKAVRLVRLASESSGDGGDLATAVGAVALATLPPEEVFRRCWQHSFKAEPGAAHLAAFHQLLESVLAENGP
ncbi:MAG: exonuclease SbcCD subunit D C-terminal domain-containing protein [Rhodospirillaceae bacterium]